LQIKKTKNNDAHQNDDDTHHKIQALIEGVSDLKFLHKLLFIFYIP